MHSKVTKNTIIVSPRTSPQLRPRPGSALLASAPAQVRIACHAPAGKTDTDTEIEDRAREPGAAGSRIACVNLRRQQGVAHDDSDGKGRLVFYGMCCRMLCVQTEGVHLYGHCVVHMYTPAITLAITLLCSASLSLLSLSHTHTRAHTHAHTHTHSLSLPPSPSLPLRQNARGFDNIEDGAMEGECDQGRHAPGRAATHAERRHATGLNPTQHTTSQSPHPDN